jgi:integrase
VQEDLARLHSKTIKEIVSIMRQTFDLYGTRNKRMHNPTAGIRIKLPDSPDPDPFELSEIDKIFSTDTNRGQELNLMKFMM